MMKGIKRPGIVLSLLMAMVWMIMSHKPADFLDELQAKFDRFMEKAQPVRVDIVFSQPLYAPGDTAFFTAWYLDEGFLPLKGSHVLTLDLINGSGATVQQTKFRIQDGKGFSQLVLSREFIPGDYKAVTYSDWMRNFGDAWYCKRDIRVVGMKEVVTKGLTGSQPGVMPEGGVLIAGIPSRIGVKGAVNTTVSIRDEQNSEVARIQTDAGGFGIGQLNPVKGAKYHAAIEGNPSRVELPAVYDDGVAVRLDAADAGIVHLSVPGGSSLSREDSYLVLTSKGKVIMKSAVRLTQESYRLTVPVQGSSLVQLFVFDSEGEVLAERVMAPRVVNDIQVGIEFPSEASQRSGVKGKISLTQKGSEGVASSFSISIVQQGMFEAMERTSYGYGSDLPELESWLTATGNTTLINDFLVTQKWYRINWPVIMSGKDPELKYPFRAPLKLTGKIVSREGDSKPPDSTLVVAYLQRNTVGYEGLVKGNEFDVPFIFDFWGEDVVFCTVIGRARGLDDRFSIQVVRDTLQLTERWSSAEGDKPSAYGEYSRNKRLVAESYSFFSTPEKKAAEARSLNQVFEEEFLEADYSVDIADYVVFPRMEDLLREVVPFVQFRKRGTEESVRISYRVEEGARTYKDDPLYIIDGVMTKSTKFFLAIKPDEVITIKVINSPNKLTQLGRLGKNGVVFVESKGGKVGTRLPSENQFPVVGLSKGNPFYEVRHSQEEKGRIPDLRPTLYWNPSASTSTSGAAEVNFFTSDDVGPIRVRVRGITPDGRPFSASQTFNVRFTPKQGN